MRPSKNRTQGRRATNSRLIAAVREFDFAQFLTNNGAPAEQRATQIAGECPYCHWRRTSFYVAPETGLFICHYCDERGGPVKLVADVLDIGYSQAVDWLVRHAGVADYYDEEDDLEEVEVPSIELPEDFFLLDGDTSIVGQPYRRYAYRRNLTDELIKRYRIGYCSGGQYQGRLIVPCYHFGALVNWVGRAISKNAEKKVMTPRGNQQTHYLFNLDNLWGLEEVVLVEGVFDALALPDIAVASFGKKISPSQINLLLQSGVKTLYIAWDSDAQAEIQRAARELQLAFIVRKVVLPEGEDPSSLSARPDVLMRCLQDSEVASGAGFLRAKP